MYVLLEVERLHVLYYVCVIRSRAVPSTVLCLLFCSIQDLMAHGLVVWDLMNGGWMMYSIMILDHLIVMSRRDRV